MQIRAPTSKISVIKRTYNYDLDWDLEREDNMTKAYTTLQIIVSGALAWLSAKLGILFPVMCLLLFAMVVDYLTGMLASKQEAIEHPNDPGYGWSSKKGAAGIIKKVGYLCIIAVGMTVDYIIINVAAAAGITISVQVFFGLAVAVWYLLNELLSIIENAGRMGAQVPEWLTRYIAVLKNKIDDQKIDDKD